MIANQINIALFNEGKRQCCVCKEIKNIDNFVKSSKRLLGYSPRCKTCDKQIREKNKDKYAKKSLEYRKLHRLEAIEREHKRRKENPEKYTQRRKELYEKNKLKINEKRRESLKDPKNKILKGLRDRLSHAIRRAKAKKYTNTKTFLGCDLTYFQNYIESLWLSGMSWDNYGHGKNKWVLDHIKPCSAFNLLDENEQKQCFHYTNIKPCWFSENAKKWSKYDGNIYYYNKSPKPFLV